MNLEVSPYAEQRLRWPSSGKAILAQFDSESIVVYQAYNPSIGHFAAKHGYFGGDFRYSRMTWIKPNFLWMMYRSGWGRKEGQEVTLAIRLKREAFEQILREAVSSTYIPSHAISYEEWKDSVSKSNVRLQWDPDHDPLGIPVDRRAIQLGLRGPVAQSYGKDWLLDIQDISAFVAEQRENVEPENQLGLLIPTEDVYPIDDPDLARRLTMSSGE